ncbi:MAG: cytochrome b [Pseudomonadota bacterium]
MVQVNPLRYSRVAMVLHWTIAVAIIAMLVMGTWMVDAIKVPETQALAFQTYQLHKSIGLTILVLSIARLIWRLLNPPPPLPAHMTFASRFAAHVAHWLFYGLMLALPISGWVMVSASAFGLPTIVFDLFEWPHIPWIVASDGKAEIEAGSKLAHRSMGYATIVLLVLHVAAALKHQFIDKDGLLGRMVPFLTVRQSTDATERSSHA